MIREAIQQVMAGNALTEAEMVDTMNEIMEGKTTDAQIACFLTALRLKGETIEELTGATRAMRAKSTPVPTLHKPDLNATPKVPRLVDTCSTGGTGLNHFNISTTSAIVTAGAGVPVAKHGNRGVTRPERQCECADGVGCEY